MAKLGTLPVTNLSVGKRGGFSIRTFDYTKTIGSTRHARRLQITIVLLYAPEDFPANVFFRPKLGIATSQIAGAF